MVSVYMPQASQKNDKAYIFPGRSGAGKTTIAWLSKDATFLGDDVSIVRKVGKEFGSALHVMLNSKLTYKRIMVILCK